MDMLRNAFQAVAKTGNTGLYASASIILQDPTANNAYHFTTTSRGVEPQRWMFMNVEVKFVEMCYQLSAKY
jgi:hypothetical protein